jgi:hypothetical protein
LSEREPTESGIAAVEPRSRAIDFGNAGEAGACASFTVTTGNEMSADANWTYTYDKEGKLTLVRNWKCSRSS